MGFLDKAKAAAMDLQQKADAAMANSGMMGGSPMGGGPMGGGGMPGGPADRLLRDLGVLTYLNAMGRPGSAEDYQRVMEQLRSLESSGGLNLSLSPAAPPGYGAPGAPPPPPGAVAAAAAASAAPPPPVAAPPPAAPMTAPVGDAPMGGYAAPPPPPVPSPAAEAGETGAAAADEANGPGAEGTAYPDPTFDETPNGDVLADSTIVDVQEQITDLGGGGGTAPPPPPPSWA